MARSRPSGSKKSSHSRSNKPGGKKVYRSSGISSGAVNTDQRVIELDVDSLGYDGRGIARFNGRACFISGALPKERVKAEIVSANNKRVEAKLIKVLDPADYRVRPSCKVYQQCGGCDFQHLDYRSQIDLKQSSVNQMLTRSSGVKDIPWGTPIMDELNESGYEYRRKVRLACYFDKNKQTLLVGFRAAKSKKLVPIKTCVVVNSYLQTLLDELNCLFDDLHQNEAYKAELYLFAHIECVADEDSTTVCFRTIKPLSDRLRNRVVHWSEQHQINVWLKEGDQDLVLISGEQPFYILQDGTKVSYTPEDFLQVNPKVNKKLVSQVIEALRLTEQDTVLDLFSGLGNFSLPVARLAKSVTAVEAIDEMVQKSILNAQQNKLLNMDAVVQDLFNEDALGWLDKGADKIILDPPRAGAELVSQHIGRTGADTIAYISCNPSSLARDTKAILEQGYNISGAHLIDMFAQTSHVETLLIFKRKVL